MKLFCCTAFSRKQIENENIFKRRKCFPYEPYNGTNKNK